MAHLPNHDAIIAIILYKTQQILDNKVHGANMGPNWVLLAPDGPHVGPMNLVIRDVLSWQVWKSVVIWYREMEYQQKNLPLHFSYEWIIVGKMCS